MAYCAAISKDARLPYYYSTNPKMMGEGRQGKQGEQGKQGKKRS
ncbi:hypothetical protein COO91_06861 [Nostoc flagelliforme CCNUN1]|uniref:Uncharacterized protein n=1 Tax=Nostoc flagelliforme CCNUN1 TaxID=2038116 RepID=A0A2K8SZH3_9NOSO|nr:hypothetical protein COO91_06861 [Nostoc flagelliforme CCNUN1]